MGDARLSDVNPNAGVGWYILYPESGTSLKGARDA